MSGTAPLAFLTSGGIGQKSTTVALIQIPKSEGEWKSWMSNSWNTPKTPGPHSFFAARKRATPSVQSVKTFDGEVLPNGIVGGEWYTGGHWSRPQRKFAGCLGAGPEIFWVSCIAGRPVSAIRYYLFGVVFLGDGSAIWKVRCESWGSPQIARDGDSIESLASSLAFHSLTWQQEYSSLKPIRVMRIDPHPQKTQFSYKYNEYETWGLATMLGDSLGYLPPLGMHSAGCAAAYLAAVDDIPKNDVNMIENVLDAISAVQSLRNPSKALKQLKGLKDPRELWLTYRYVLTTGQLDVQELRSFTSQLASIPKMRTIKLHGTYSRGEILYRASGQIQSARILSDVQGNAQKALGLDPSLTKLWDIVPYSFIVDWFIPIQELFSTVESMGTALSTTVSDVWYSYETSYDGQNVYARLSGGTGSLVGLPYLNFREASDRTIAMRVTDALAIFSK